MKQHSNDQSHLNIKLFIRNFIIELILYGSLVVGYYLLALRYLNTYLTNVFQNNLLAYAVLALVLIIAQGVLLDSLTSFLLNKIKLGQLE
jgi:hypothetical protein